MTLPARRSLRRRRRAWLPAVGLCSLLLTALPAAAQENEPAPAPAKAGREKIDPTLLLRMDTVRARGDGRVEAAVVLRDRTGLPGRGADPGTVRDELTRSARSVQSPVVDLSSRAATGCSTGVHRTEVIPADA